METRININYTPSKTSEVFGLFTLSFQGSDGKVHSVDTKFNPKQLWEFSRDTSSVAFDLLVLSMIVYNVDRAVLRLSNSDDGWKRNLILLNVPVINLEDMNKGREAFNKAINFLTGDNWDIHFIQADSYSYNPTKKVKEYNPQFFEKVALFSGGLDSLIGFIDEASTLSVDKKILLVSHMELGKEHSDQKSILKYCRENNIFSNKYEQVLLNAGLKPHSWNIKTPTESTFRSRSLLFFAAGIYIANKIFPSFKRLTLRLILFFIFVSTVDAVDVFFFVVGVFFVLVLPVLVFFFDVFFAFTTILAYHLCLPALTVILATPFLRALITMLVFLRFTIFITRFPDVIIHFVFFLQLVILNVSFCPTLSVNLFTLFASAFIAA